MKLSPQAQLDWILRILKTLQGQKFYGKVTLDIQHGNVLRIEKRESIKPPENLNGEPKSQGQACCRTHQESAAQDEQAHQAQEEGAQKA